MLSPLNENNINLTIKSIEEADLLLIVGTSLSVYPASNFVHFFKGKYLVIINNDITPLDNKANLVINENIGTVFEKLK